MRYDQEVKIKQAAEETRRRRRCVAHVLRCVHVLAGPLCVLDVVAAGRTSTASAHLRLLPRRQEEAARAKEEEAQREVCCAASGALAGPRLLVRAPALRSADLGRVSTPRQALAALEVRKTRRTVADQYLRKPSAPPPQPANPKCVEHRTV